jgi:hypothetical protein
MLGVVRSRISNVVQYLFSIEPIPLGDGQHTCRSKSPLGINVQALTLSSAHTDRELTCDGEGMADLGFTRSEFA